MDTKPDKYTQMAEEWVRDNFTQLLALANGDVTELAALLRRVAREAASNALQNEADSLMVSLQCACSRYYDSRGKIDPECYYHKMLERADALRARAKELATETSSPGPKDSR